MNKQEVITEIQAVIEILEDVNGSGSAIEKLYNLKNQLKAEQPQLPPEPIVFFENDEKFEELLNRNLQNKSVFDEVAKTYKQEIIQHADAKLNSFMAGIQTCITHLNGQVMEFEASQQKIHQLLGRVSKHEVSKFNEWIPTRTNDMTTSLLPWPYNDTDTYIARQGWEAALNVVREVLAENNPKLNRVRLKETVPEGKCEMCGGHGFHGNIYRCTDCNGTGDSNGTN